MSDISSVVSEIKSLLSSIDSSADLVGKIAGYKVHIHSEGKGKRKHSVAETESGMKIRLDKGNVKVTTTDSNGKTHTNKVSSAKGNRGAKALDAEFNANSRARESLNKQYETQAKSDKTKRERKLSNQLKSTYARAQASILQLIEAKHQNYKESEPMSEIASKINEFYSSMMTAFEDYMENELGLKSEEDKIAYISGGNGLRQELLNLCDEVRDEFNKIKDEYSSPFDIDGYDL